MSHSLLVFDDVPDARAWIDLPALRLGDRLNLELKIHRRKAGRTEMLHVSGEYRVTSFSFDAVRPVPCQVYRVASMGAAPGWRAVKSLRSPRLGPARYPRTAI